MIHFILIQTYGCTLNVWTYGLDIHMADYFYSPNAQRAFSIARSNAMPSDVLYGKFRGISTMERNFTCPLGGEESLQHMILYCLFYKDLSSNFLERFLRLDRFGEN